MPINSKAKGVRGELKFCKLCHENGFEEVRRSAQYCGNTGDAADVVGLPYLHVEVKAVEKLNLREAMRQAIHDAKEEGRGNIPIVAHKKSNRPWLITIGAKDFFEIYSAYLEKMGE
jgi:Holliday junction resolvase